MSDTPSTGPRYWMTGIGQREIVAILPGQEMRGVCEVAGRITYGEWVADTPENRANVCVPIPDTAVCGHVRATVWIETRVPDETS